MDTIQKYSVVKNVLKNLCCSYGWSYGAFWSYDQPNSLLLTLQDTYCDERFGSLIDNLLLQIPLGGGIIGQAAYANKHMWISSEDHYREHTFSGSIWDMFADNGNEFRHQFSSGIKTIAVIPVEPQGVVQFGSSEKIPENMNLVNQTKRMFQEIISGRGSEIALTSSNSQDCHQNEAFASLISSEESCFTGGDGCLMGFNSSSATFDQLPDFGIPEDFFQTGDFNASQWFPPLNPVDYDGKYESECISGTNIDLWGHGGDLRDILAPIIDGSHSSFQSYSNVDCTTLCPKERLFSKLGIDELLEGVSGISNAGSSSCIEGQAYAKRRKTGHSMREEAGPKSQPGLQMLDSYSMSGSSTIVQAKKHVELPKPTKKKAKPGTRPRPKDRQLILDRMAELRQLIPNGEKMSIDCLLDRTIKHMIFLESVTKQADKIRQADKPKHNGVVSSDPSANGVTWACEMGNQTMVCPLIVEDLGDPGHMLIEMLCEEQGLFLEIVDIIRRFGLIILKGVMESRGDKIWAHFIVESEVNKNITRHEIFTALVQFLQTIAPNVDTKCMKTENSILDDFYQPWIQNPVNSTDMPYCVNL
uniref:transcription factor LHW-like n=1 Tax=Erigeron canadensis TaxID=72917 RepID=UPI001CB913CF|nr:transcription factor LHW-like [Erigeron canadensis]